MLCDSVSRGRGVPSLSITGIILSLSALPCEIMCPLYPLYLLYCPSESGFPSEQYCAEKVAILENVQGFFSSLLGVIEKFDVSLRRFELTKARAGDQLDRLGKQKQGNG